MREKRVAINALHHSVHVLREESKQLVAPDFPSFLEFVGREKRA